MYGMHVEDETKAEEVIANEPLPTPERVVVRNEPMLHRTDIVGRFLDGEDYILNNPPGFAVSATMEYMKEHNLDRI
ncbi:hypothetical protein LCGC14_2661380 [marine sediment metagenome]|uniref:Uncharacterized protein n=1 Tax=marine sediment metagenome TaxID=412755 RepID=A0A0F9CIS2_9ZZZZ